MSFWSRLGHKRKTGVGRTILPPHVKRLSYPSVSAGIPASFISDVQHTGTAWRQAESTQPAESPLDLPSFIVVGPPRTGTSWLHEVLNQHTNLPSPTKETRFFDSHFARGLDWYRHHFPSLKIDRLTGEVAPTYFCSPDARERIALTIPHAKLVFIFRAPIERVVSLYRMKRAYGMLPWTLEEALHRDPELLESGRYATYLQQWKQSFPEHQLLVTFHDDLRNAPQAYMDKLSAFLGIPRIILTKSDLGHVHSSERMTEPRNFLITKTALAVGDWCKARNLDNVVASVRNSHLIKLFLGGGAPFLEMSPSAREKIASVLRPEVDALETMTGRDLSRWKASFKAKPAERGNCA